jgi:hypothetical protein
MNRQELIRMAREAGLMSVRMSKALEEIRFSQLDHFATLVAAVEREVCAQVCEQLGQDSGYSTGRLWGNGCATAIRARSKT